jgi:hypothetical protein
LNKSAIVADTECKRVAAGSGGKSSNLAQEDQFSCFSGLRRSGRTWSHFLRIGQLDAKRGSGFLRSEFLAKTGNRFSHFDRERKGFSYRFR